jgi:hypothetical protein
MTMAPASYWTIVNPKGKWQIWDGWGASLAWWANAFGGGPKADELADILFTRKRVKYVGYDPSGFAQVAGNDGKVERWATTDTGNSKGERYHYHADDTKLQNGKKFWAWFPPNSVQTFEIENVSL